ncbi:rRNA-processing protein UTP23 homolog [Myxocyprinus asiaticus]|uniref:rRNA-processing protein UTP23 homolog n=1 Tax=Myxocyprinus asiaticus TaxID=70543 RepID=UPI002222BFA9|nr:rRNA-processing protein UTP23 homolog [Myxocyprinus asiaticus]
MKIKRQKHAKKTISFYKYNFCFRQPFQILIDGTFCQAALKNKIQIKEQLPKYLMGEIHLCTTNCALKELETLPKELYGAKLILQRFQVRQCKHKDPVPASQCLLSMLGEANPHHYFVATQDQELTTALKKIPGVPLLYIILNTMVLDKPSECTLKYVEAVQLGEMVSTSQQKSIQSLKEQQGLGKDGEERRGKKRKRKSGNPNPLSCLKKKKTMPQQPKKTDREKKKRNRHRKKKPAGGEGAPVNLNQSNPTTA